MPKISDYLGLSGTAVNSLDLITMVDVSESSGLKNKKITFAEFLLALKAQLSELEGPVTIGTTSPLEIKGAVYGKVDRGIYGGSTFLNPQPPPAHPNWSPVNNTILSAITQKIYVDLNYFTTNTEAGSFVGADGTQSKPYGSIQYAMTTGCSWTTGAVEIIVTGASSRVATGGYIDLAHRAVDFVIHPATDSRVLIGGTIAGQTMGTIYDTTSTATGWTGSVEMWGFDFVGYTTTTSVWTPAGAGTAVAQVAIWLHHNKIAMTNTASMTNLVTFGNTGQLTDVWITDNEISGIDVIFYGAKCKNLVIERNYGSVGNTATQTKDMVSCAGCIGQVRIEGNRLTGTIKSAYGFYTVASTNVEAIVIRKNRLEILNTDANSYRLIHANNPSASATKSTYLLIDDNVIYSSGDGQVTVVVGDIATVNQSRAALNQALLAQDHRFSYIGVTRNVLINRHDEGMVLAIGSTAVPAEVSYNFIKAGPSTGSGSGDHVFRCFANRSHVHNNIVNGLLFLFAADECEIDHNTVISPGNAFLAGIPSATSFEAPVGLDIHHNLFVSTGVGGRAFTDYAYNGSSYALPRLMDWKVDHNCYYAPDGMLSAINSLGAVSIDQARNVWSTGTLDGSGTSPYNAINPANDASSINADPEFLDLTSEDFSAWIPRNSALMLSDGDYIGACRVGI